MHHLNLIGESGQESLASLNNALIYDEMEGSIRISQEIKKIKDHLKATNQKNEFINFFIRDDKNGTKKNKTGINRVRTQNLVKLSNNKANRIQTSFISLLKDKTTRAAVTHLIHYEMVKNGFQQKAGSFLQVIAPALPDIQIYLGEAKRVKDLLSTKFKNLEEVNEGFKDVLGLTLNETLQDLSQWFKSAKDSYYIPSIKKVQLDTKKGVRSPVYKRDNTLVVDYYQGKPEVLAKYKTKNPNDKRIFVPAITSIVLDKFETPSPNQDKLQKAGFKFVEDGIIFPPVISTSEIVSDGSTLKKYYYLDRLFSPYTKDITSNNLYDTTNVSKALIGTTAQYVEFDLLGSKDQWKMGFMFNIAKINGKTQLQPTATEIRNRQNLVNEQVIPYVEDFYGEGDIGFVPPFEPRNTVSSTDINLVEATNDKIDFKKGGEVVGSTENQDAQTIINANVIVDKKKAAPASAFSKAEGVGAKFSKDKLGPQTKKDNNYIDVITEWFQSTPVKQLNRAAEANMLPGSRLKDFVTYYEKTRNVTNLDDFIYRLKNCN